MICTVKITKSVFSTRDSFSINNQCSSEKETETAREIERDKHTRCLQMAHHTKNENSVYSERKKSSNSFLFSIYKITFGISKKRIKEIEYKQN